MAEIIELFDKEKNGIIHGQLAVKKLIRSTPDKVFQKIKKDGVFTLVPATNAIGIVLRYNFTKEPTLETLEQLMICE